MSSLQDDLNTFHIQRRDLVQANEEDTAATEPTANETLASAVESPPEQEIDLGLLARKVYDLFKQELRIERERLGQP